MAFMGFSEWMVAKEAVQPLQTVGAKASSKPSPVSGEIKKVVADNIAKPKQARSAALMALVKKKQNDPKATPKDLQAIADAMPDAKL